MSADFPWALLWADYALLAGLCCAAGVAAHALFYQATELLPEVWRNLLRYVIGGLLVTVATLVWALLHPGWPGWAVGVAGPVALCGAGYGTYLGYLLDRHI